MVWHEGTCCICGQVTLVGTVGCTGDDMCKQCFEYVQAMLPVFEQAVKKIIDNEILISKLELN